MKMVLFLSAFLTGILAAFFMHGQMTHLRMLLPATALPAWSGHILPDSRLIRGVARLPQTAPFSSELDLRWRISGLRPWGLVVDIDIAGQGLSLRGYVEVPLGFSQALFTGTMARIDLEAISGPTDFLQLDGQLTAQDISIRFDPVAGTINNMLISGDVSNVTFENEPVGNGTFTIESDPQRTWWSEARVAGDAVEMSFALNGNLNDDVARLDLEIRDQGTMPARWKARLGLIMQSRGDTLSLSRSIALR